MKGEVGTKKPIMGRILVQWNPVNATTVGPQNPGRNNEVVALTGSSK